MDAAMSENEDFIPASRIRIESNDSTSISDALYSNPIEEMTNSVSSRPLTPRFYPVEGVPTQKSSDASGNSGTLEKRGRQDSVSTGTFGNLVKRASNEEPVPDKVREARQRIRFNLLKVGPKKTKGDHCEAWRKYLF
jgi:hypothetical protein